MGLGLSLKDLGSGISESLGFHGHDQIGSTVGKWMNNVSGTTDAFNNSVKSQWDFWNANNAYNSPVNQMNLYKEAGLNPNMVVNGSIHSYASGSSPSMSAGGTGVLNTIMSIMGLKSELALRAAQTRLVNGQADALDLENDENEGNGTSRSTPYPVKLVKSAVNNVVAASNGLAAMVDSKVGNSDVFNIIDDVISGRVEKNKKFYRSLNAKDREKYKQILKGLGYEDRDFRDW